MNAPQPRFRISRHRRTAWLGSGLAAVLSVIGLLVSWLNPGMHRSLFERIFTLNLGGACILPLD